MFVFWIGPNPTQLFWCGLGRPSYAGWARIGPAMNNGSPLFTCYVNSGEWIIIHFPLFLSRTVETEWRRRRRKRRRRRRRRRRRKGRGKGLTCGGSKGGVAGGCWPENGLDGGRPFFFFFSVFFLLLYSPLFLFSFSIYHGAVVVCAAVALKAVLLAVADRIMAWMVVDLSSSSSLCFFFCYVLLCFCFLLQFLTMLLWCVLRWLWRRYCWWCFAAVFPVCAEAHVSAFSSMVLQRGKKMVSWGKMMMALAVLVCLWWRMAAVRS